MGKVVKEGNEGWRECEDCGVVDILRHCWRCGDVACEVCLRRFHEHRDESYTF